MAVLSVVQWEELWVKALAHGWVEGLAQGTATKLVGKLAPVVVLQMELQSVGTWAGELVREWVVPSDLQWGAVRGGEWAHWSARATVLVLETELGLGLERGSALGLALVKAAARALWLVVEWAAMLEVELGSRLGGEREQRWVARSAAVKGAARVFPMASMLARQTVLKWAQSSA
jgi:hypothetical protein